MQTTPSTSTKATKRLRRMQRLTGAALALVATLPLFNWGIGSLAGSGKG